MNVRDLSKLLMACIAIAMIALNSCNVETEEKGKEYHVAKTGDNNNDGTIDAPLLTIQAVADFAQPGDIITVHEGIYRERINPPRGGINDNKRIVYQAAEGETVVIKGSEVVKEWKHIANDTWKSIIPNNVFGKFNPYEDTIQGDWFHSNGRQHHTGAVYLNGHWLYEASKQDEVPIGAVITDKFGKVLAKTFNTKACTLRVFII